MKFVFLLSFFLLTYIKLNGQNQISEPNCVHVVKSSNPSDIIKYLGEKHGFEQAEKILIRMANFESQNEVIVLFGKTYFSALAKIDQLIATEQDAHILNELKAKKSRLVNFSSIENQLTY